MFAVYRLREKNCDFVRSVTVAGAICESISDAAKSIKPKKKDTMPWELSGADLCHAVVAKHGIETDAAACKVVVDATYGRDDALLMEINHIWGFSYYWWTPILLRMSAIFGGRRPKGKATPVEHFRLDPEPGFVYEFLYLQRSHTKGTCSWGRTGMVNAALLYPDALTHLLGQIGFTQKSR